MALKISPRSKLDMTLGEEYAFRLNLNETLKGNTVASYTFKIYDSSGVEAPTLSGDSSISAGYITFGIKAVATGKYTIIFIITCNELLPDGVTPYEPYVAMTVTIT